MGKYRVKGRVLDRAFAQFEPISLRALLHAAATSSATRERLPSVAVLWRHALRTPPRGDIEATPEHLPRLLKAAHFACAAVRTLEDFVPHDPRTGVRYTFNGQRFSVDPGLLEQPLASLRGADHFGVAVDPSLIDRLGFGLRDVLELALRLMSLAVEGVRPVWPEGETTEITDAEVAASAELLRGFEPEALIAQCAAPARAAAAWQWATCRPDELPLDLEPMQPMLGHVLGVRTGAGSVPVPPGLVPESVVRAIRTLCAEASQEPASQERLALVAQRRAYEVLRGLGGHRSGPTPTPSEEAAMVSRGVVVRARRHALAFTVTAEFGTLELAQAIDDAAAWIGSASMSEVVGAEVPATALAPDAEITRIVVYDGPCCLLLPRSAGVVPIHVDELRALLLLARAEEEGANLLLDFLRDLSTVDREIPAMELVALFRWWLQLGAFNVAGRAPVLVLSPVADDAEWTRAARLAGVDDLLHACGMPPAEAWEVVRDVAPGVVLLGAMSRGEIALAAPEASLVVACAIPVEPLAPGVDRWIVFRLAEAVAEAVAALGVPLVADGGLLVLVLSLAQPAPDAHEGVEVGFSVTEDDSRTVWLRLGVDLLLHAAVDPAFTHDLLGRLLVSARRLSEGLSYEEACEGADAVGDTFMAAWNALEPVVRIGAEAEPIPVADAPADLLPTGRSVRARADDAVARAVHTAGVAPGRYAGEEASTICRDSLYPAMLHLIQARLHQVKADDAFTAISACVNHAYANRIRSRLERSLALSAPWRDEAFAAALADPDPSIYTWPLDMLLELVVAAPPPGSGSIDNIDVAELAAVASRAQQVGYVVVAGAVQPMCVVVTEGGDVRVGDGVGTGDVATHVDVGAYMAARRMHEARLAYDYPIESVNPTAAEVGVAREDVPFSPLTEADVPPRFMMVDRAMRDSMGTGFNGIVAVTGTAINCTAEGAVGSVTADHLVSEARAWSGLPEREIRAAVRLLTLTGEGLRATGFRYWEKRARSSRLATRPLVEFADRLWVMPYQVLYSRDVFLRYITDGRLPWPGGDVPPAVAHAMNEFRKKLNKDLEHEVAARVRAAGLTLRENVKPEDAIPAGIDIPGEIDVLTFDPVRERLFVIEVKDLGEDFTPREVASSVSKFHSARGYVAKLLAKADAVRNQADAAVRFVGASPRRDNIDIVPLMVTRGVEAAAFVKNARVPFVTADDLPAALTGEAPAAGHFPVRRGTATDTYSA